MSGLRGVARAHQLLLAHDHAQPMLNEEIRIGRREGLRARLGETLLTRGALRRELGRPKAARHDFEQAARLLGPSALSRSTCNGAYWPTTLDAWMRQNAQSALDPSDQRAYPAWCTFTACGAG
jgi:hypothetical protein